MKKLKSTNFPVSGSGNSKKFSDWREKWRYCPVKFGLFCCLFNNTIVSGMTFILTLVGEHFSNYHFPAHKS